MAQWVSKIIVGEPFWAFPRRAHGAATRVTAALTAVGIVVAWWQPGYWIIEAVTLDFALRVLGGPRLSPMARLALVVARAIGLPPTTVAGAPKQMAAMVGTAMVGAALVLIRCEHPVAGWSVAGLVALFASLEAAVGLCVVCRIYDRFIPCPDCVRGSGEGI